MSPTYNGDLAVDVDTDVNTMDDAREIVSDILDVRDFRIDGIEWEDDSKELFSQMGKRPVETLSANGVTTIYVDFYGEINE